MENVKDKYIQEARALNDAIDAENDMISSDLIIWELAKRRLSDKPKKGVIRSFFISITNSRYATDRISYQPFKVSVN